MDFIEKYELLDQTDRERIEEHLETLLDYMDILLEDPKYDRRNKITVNHRKDG